MFFNFFVLHFPESFWIFFIKSACLSFSFPSLSNSFSFISTVDVHWEKKFSFISSFSFKRSGSSDRKFLKEKIIFLVQKFLDFIFLCDEAEIVKSFARLWELLKFKVLIKLCDVMLSKIPKSENFGNFLRKFLFLHPMKSNVINLTSENASAEVIWA